MEGRRAEDGGEDVGVWEENVGSLLEGVREGGRGELLDGDNFRVPIVVEGQEVFRFIDGFLGRLKRCRDLEGMDGLLGKHGTGWGWVIYIRWSVPTVIFPGRYLGTLGVDLW